MRILLLEDETLLRNQLQELLQQEGYIVDASGNGEEGLYLGNEYPLDAGIIDIGLPGISGLEVIQKLRTNNRNFPILILTARGRWQEKVEGLEAGADDYLTKPFEVQELLARLRAILRRSSGHATSIIHDLYLLRVLQKVDYDITSSSVYGVLEELSRKCFLPVFIVQFGHTEEITFRHCYCSLFHFLSPLLDVS
mgnify:CR=1 FL=1